jgi:hypothetical protein
VNARDRLVDLARRDLVAAGFGKKGRMFWRKTPELVQSVTLQFSQFGPHFYVHLGFHMDPSGALVNASMSDVQVRFELQLENVARDLCATLDQDDAEKVAMLWSEHILPWLLPTFERTQTRADLARWLPEVRGAAITRQGRERLAS